MNLDFDETIKMAYAGNELALERLRVFAAEMAEIKGIGKVDKVGIRRLLVWLKKLPESDKQLFKIQ